MKLSKANATSTEFLPPEGITPETFEYRHGSRGALELVIDQYRVTRNEQSSIASYPNRLDGEE